MLTVQAGSFDRRLAHPQASIIEVCRVGLVGLVSTSIEMERMSLTFCKPDTELERCAKLRAIALFSRYDGVRQQKTRDYDWEPRYRGAEVPKEEML